MTTGKIQQARQGGIFVLKIIGEVRLDYCCTLDAVIRHIFSDEHKVNLTNIIIDLTEATNIDSTILGLLARISILFKEKTGFLPLLETSNEDIMRILESMGFEHIFNIVGEPQHGIDTLHDLPTQVLSEDEVKARVLDAHKVLMTLNDSNRSEFQDLVSALEEEENRDQSREEED